MKRKIGILIGVLVLVLVFVGVWYYGPHSSQSKETTQVKIANLAVVQGLPVYLAIEKGYFKDAGLDVQLIKFDAPNQIIDAIMNGQVDMTSPSGAMGIAGIAESKNPGKFKIYAAAGGNDVIQNDAILVKNNSSIKTIQELRGKKLGILAGSIQWQTIAKDILAQNGLEAGKDVTLVDLPVGLQAQSLASEQIDALLAIEPIPTVVKAKGIGKEIADHTTARYIANPFYAGAGIINTAFVQKNPSTANKVLEVLDRAMTEINQNPDAARQYLKGYTSLDEATAAAVPVCLFKFYKNFTQDDIGAIQKFYDIFPKYGVVKDKIDFSEIVY